MFQIGSWNTKTGVNITVNIAQKVQDDRERLKNMTLRVVTIYVSKEIRSSWINLSHFVEL